MYDSKYNQVLYTLYLTSGLTYGSGLTIAFDEGIDAFSSFYTFASPLYIPFTNGYMSVDHYNPTGSNHEVDFLYYHNSMLKDKCCFYSRLPADGEEESSLSTAVSKYYPSTVKTIFNDYYSSSKVFDTGFYSAEVTLDGIELQDVSFDKVYCYNKYQNTSEIALTYLDNLRRREREWNYVIPRNLVDTTYTSNSDPSLPANQDATRLFKERMRDKYLITELTFTNTNNRRMVVPYVGVRYRISYR